MAEAEKRSTKKKRKVFHIAKDLKLTTPTILEFLESRGHDISRKQMSPVTEEMYVDLLKRFDKTRFQQYQNDLAANAGKEKDTEKLREAELEKIIAAKEEVGETKPDEPESIVQTKIELPTFQAKVIEKAKSKDEKKEAKPKKTKKSSAKKAPAEEEIEPAEDLKLEEVAPTAEEKEVEEVKAAADLKEDIEEDKPEETVAAESTGKRKIELPKAQTLKVIEEAPKKVETVEEVKPAVEEAPKKKKKRLRRKRTPIQVEPQEPVVEIIEETKPDTSGSSKKKTLKAVEQPKADGKPGRRRKRKRGKEIETVGSEKPQTGRSKRRKKVDQKEVDAKIKETFAKISDKGKGRHKSSKTKETETGETEVTVLQVTEFMTTQELANRMEVPVPDVIKSCLDMGMMVTINQRLDNDTMVLIAAEYEIDIEFIQQEDEETEVEEVIEANLVSRSPVVTIMGHVDHGKTTLLDYLRRTHVAEGEAGGITQHIGAYEVTYEDSRITFLDTPGHEAFTAMRARGAQITDLVVLIVAADDRVMPQTLEAIDHAKAANVPIIIAVNKVDKSGANPEAVYQQLSEQNILVEKWGGKYQSAEISAKFGQGVDDLLAEILVAADVLELRADPTIRARGIVVESRLDKGLGAVATILIESGTLKVGESFVIGQHYGKVRALYSDDNSNRSEAGPATPVQVVGFNGVPQAGDRLMVQDNEKIAREISQKRQRQQREMSARQIKALTLEQVNRKIKESELNQLPLIIKGDVHGSVEVLSDALMKLSTEEVQVDIIHRSVGGIAEADVMLASASGAIIIGFHVHPNTQARELARQEGVEIRLYRIIHEVVDEVRSSLEGLLAPDKEERIQGTVEIRKVFRISRIGSVAGCYVTEGKINRKSRVRLIRDSVEIWDGELDSLKRFKEDVKEVGHGFECGLGLHGFNDIRENDIVQAYEIVELARKLEKTA